MDSVIKVRRSFLNRIRGFCNIFASMCTGCYRSPCACALSDEIGLAKMLIVEIDHIRDADEEKFFINNPNEEFLACIEKAIRQGNGNPVRSDEIKIPGECRQRKARALATLVKRRRIIRIDNDGIPFYAIADGTNNTTDNTTNKD